MNHQSDSLPKPNYKRKGKSPCAPFVIFRECWKPCLIHLRTQTPASFKQSSVFSNEVLIICAILLFTANMDSICLMLPRFDK